MMTGAFNTGGGKGLNVPSFVGNAPDDFIGGELHYVTHDP
jgi:hypothetical protein